MKCPYRTVTTIEEFRKRAKIERIERVEYLDCIKEECPFWETVIEPCCRRADNETNT